jgi:hypothetical protein
MAVRNLTTGNDLDFDSATTGIQPWSFNATDAELGPAPETADGVFVRLTGAAKIDNLRATIIGTPYQSWMSGFPAIAGNDRLANADPDRDGVANLLEWVLDGDPGSSDASIQPFARISDGDLIFTFRRRDDSEQSMIRQIVQHGTDLTHWTDLVIGAMGGSGYAVEESGASPDLITVTLPAAGNSQRFVRLMVTENVP